MSTGDDKWGHEWDRPAARYLATWLVALATPASLLTRPVWAARVAWHALTGRTPK